MNFESTLTIANKVSFHYDHHHCHHHHHHHHHHHYQRHHYDGLQPQYAIINNDTNLKTIEVSITHTNQNFSAIGLLNSFHAFTVPGDVRDDAEVIDGHRRDEDFDDFKGVIDTGVGYTFLRPNPQATAFNFGFYDSFEDILRRIKDALTSPVVYSTHDEDSDEIVYHMKRDPVKMNKTSTVKVIDGHKVEINDTQYNNKNSHFRVRVINIRPLDDDVKVGEANDTVKTVTSGPDTIKNRSNVTTPGSEEESDERREPLEKKPQDNEIRGNIDSNEVKL
uniref:Uncharacterized protein n=1 Tax=Glossina palpalis gambiensis TaxID=67801 RepID=A0A1B0AT32_9MUSC